MDDSLLTSTGMTDTATPMTLKTAREAAGMTQMELAVAAGAHPTQVSRWEAGVVPRAEMRERLSAALGLAPTAITWHGGAGA